ncbi:hypothetical protein GCM10023172_05690 [Hymenobacter ginsengisoli]|uniref:DUF3826 domain-containing protein n=1 Tax=Hymenobacter ginsengisoli TaxID=1051626 RepID=A0ABP8PYY3_9BACT|nr:MULTISPECIES: DUF3826 domain-containing protein [unclassified Hymenobacter]MBO2033892.1 DUF3826 domain-containing protein [Hymenobacter sp. BT559]
MSSYFKTAAGVVGLGLWATSAAYGQAPASSAAAPPMSADAKAAADQEADKKAADWVASLQLNDAKKAAAVQQVIATHLRAIRAYSNAHPYTETPAGINPTTGKPLSTMDRQLIAVSAMPKAIHENLMSGLRQQLTPEQVEAVLDKYTIGKVAFTLNGYKAIVPNLTPTEEQVILTNLKQAREQAVDFKNMKEISAVFEIYKSKNEEYLNTHGRNWRELFKAYVDAANAKKAADKAKAQEAAKTPQK